MFKKLGQGMIVFATVGAVVGCTSAKVASNTTPLKNNGRAPTNAVDASAPNDRYFRVNRTEIATDGFAIGWGVPGQKTDFEALEKDSKAVDNFNQTQSPHNYLVDLETNRILVDLNPSGDTLDYYLGGMRVGNHFSYGIQSLTFSSDEDGKNTDRRYLVAVLTNYKWDGGVYKLYFVRKTDSSVETIDEIPGFPDQLTKAVQASLSTSQWKTMQSRGSYTYSIEERNYQGKLNGKSYVGPINYVTIYAQTPKSDAPSYVYTGIMSITSQAGHLAVKMQALDFKKAVY